MRRGRIFFYLAFILILGLVAVLVIGQRFLRPSQPTGGPAVVQPTAVESVQIVVLTQKVERGGIIKEEVLQERSLPKDMFIQGMASSPNEVIGRQARFDLEAGIPLTASMLVNSTEQLSATGSVAALSIPRGMVAVSIPINRLSAVSYAPQAGDHVNMIVTMMFVDLDSDFQTILPNRSFGVIAPGAGTATTTAGTGSGVGGPGTGGTGTGEEGSGSLQVTADSLVAQVSGGGLSQGKAAIDSALGQTFYLGPSEAQRPRLASQTLLQDAVVLRMGDFPLQGQEPSSEATPEGENPEEAAAAPPLPDLVTLIVSPQDAITLNYLMYMGAEMTLALRAAGDDSRIETEAVTLQFLLDQYRIPVPVKLPYGSHPRVDQLIAPVPVPAPVVTPE